MFGTPAGDLSENDLLRDFATVNDLSGTNTVTGVITGPTLQTLFPSRQTTLYLFGAGAAADQNSTFELTHVFDDPFTGNPLTTVADTNSLTNHFASFDFVTPDQIELSDSISFNWTVPPGRAGRTSLNGFALVQAVAVPEPNAMMALALGAFVVVLQRRKRIIGRN